MPVGSVIHHVAWTAKPSDEQDWDKCTCGSAAYSAKENVTPAT